MQKISKKFYCAFIILFLSQGLMTYIYPKMMFLSSIIFIAITSTLYFYWHRDEQK
jgi:predicted membrane protein